MELKLKVSEVKVVTGSGPDRVSLTVNKPGPVKMYRNLENLSLEFTATAGDGVRYLKEDLGVTCDIEVIQTGIAKMKFSKEKDSE